MLPAELQGKLSLCCDVHLQSVQTSGCCSLRSSHTPAVQLYEREAVLRWVDMRHTVPHSPTDLAFANQLSQCPRMQRLVEQFAAEFGLRLAVV